MPSTYKKHEALCSSCEWKREKFLYYNARGCDTVRAVIAWADYYICIIR